MKIGYLSACFPQRTFEDGYRELVLCESIVKSAKEEKWVEI